MFLLCVPACDSAVPDTDEVVLGAQDGKFDSVRELRVRAAGTTLWVNKTLVRATRGEQTGFVLTGRTSRNLSDGFAFVMDDPYGAFAITGPRRFEVFFATTEAASLLSGVNLFASLGLATGGADPLHLTSRTRARVRLGAFSGSGISLRSDVVPVINAGLPVWRIKGTTTNPIVDLSLRVDGSPVGTSQTKDDTHFQVDLSRDEVIALAGSGRDLTFAATGLRGSAVKTARLGVVVSALGLTQGDAYEVWPAPACTDEVKNCLSSLPEGTLDLGLCGEALAVHACSGQID